MVNKTTATTPGQEPVHIELTGDELTEYNARIADYEANKLPKTKESKIKEVKIEARRRIEAIAPPWKQDNMAGFLLRLQDKEVITPEELTEKTAINSLYDQIKAIRGKSDLIEADINALTIYEDLVNFDIANNPLWD